MTSAVCWEVVLFDVDGTLVDAAGVGRRALDLALERHLGPTVRPEEPWLHGLELHGATDRLIIREALEAEGRPFDEALCDRILATYVEVLEGIIGGPGSRALPGCEALLAALQAAGTLIGLCTGNVPGGARLKLARVGLDRFFDFDQGANGFGSDAEPRREVVAAALRRASARLGRPVDPARALVVGDTPRDVAAARANGCPTLAVATGRYGVEALREAGAEHAAPTLERLHVGALLLGDADPAEA